MLQNLILKFPDEDGRWELSFSNKTANINDKNLLVYNQVTGVRAEL